MSADRGTAADQQLRQQLLELGISAEPRQLKRWREAKLLAAPVRRAAGRGQGRPSVAYPPESVAQASTILECLRGGIPLRHVAAIMFYRAVPVHDHAVRRSYLEILTDLEALLAEDEDRGDAADKLAQQLRRRAKRTPLGRRWIARAGTYGARVGSPVEDTLVALTAHIFGGDEPTDTATQAMTSVLGVPTDAAAIFVAVLRGLSLPQLRNVLVTSTGGELDAARACERRVRAIAIVLDELSITTGQSIADGFSDAALTEEVSCSLGVLVVAVIRREDSALDEKLTTIETAIAEAQEVIESAREHQREFDIVNPRRGEY